jgi:hypothetical protein
MSRPTKQIDHDVAQTVPYTPYEVAFVREFLYDLGIARVSVQDVCAYACMHALSLETTVQKHLDEVSPGLAGAVLPVYRTTLQFAAQKLCAALRGVWYAALNIRDIG